MRNVIRALTVVAFAFGCGDKEIDGAASQAPPAERSAAGTGLEEINGSVPAPLRNKLAFEMTEGERGYFRVAVPAGWKASFMPGTYEPPEGSPFGRTTRMRVSTNCDGSCEPKDWAATVEKVEFARLAPESIERDDKGDDNRVAVARTGDRVEIVAAWWKPGASRYYYCRATLSKPLAPAADAFVKACQSMTILHW